MSLFKSQKLCLFIIILVSFFTYINIYNNEFISDDVNTIVQNEDLGNLSLYLKSVSIFDIIHSINFLIGGLNPPVYHLTNILFHAGNVILVYILVGLLLSSFDPKTKTNHKWLSLASALLFATHPIHTEVVTWISGGPYAVYTFFLLLSFILFIHYTNHNSNAGRNSIRNLAEGASRKVAYRFLILSLLFFFLALSTTQKAIILPFLLTAYLLSIGKIKTRLSSLSIFFIVALFAGLTFLPTVSKRAIETTAYLLEKSTVYNPLEQIPIAIGTYIKLLLIPVNLSFFHEIVITPGEYILMTLITVIFFFLIFVFYQKQRIFFFALSFFLVSLFPVLLPVKIAWVVAERYVYLGSVGFSLFTAIIIFKIGELSKQSKLKNVLLLIFLFLYLPLTLLRNRDWQNKDVFWPATVKASPLSHMARNNMGNYYIQHGNVDSAIKEFTKATELTSGNYPQALYNLGSAYLLKKDTSQAIKFYEKALSLNPNLLEAYLQIGSVYLSQKDYQKAESVLLKALSVDPSSSRVYNDLGVIAYEKEDFLLAKTYFRQALAKEPNNTSAQKNLELIK